MVWSLFYAYKQFLHRILLGINIYGMGGGGGGMDFLFIIRYNEIVPTYLLFHFASMLRIIGKVRFICMLCLLAYGNLVFSGYFLDCNLEHPVG